VIISDNLILFESKEEFQISIFLAQLILFQSIFPRHLFLSNEARILFFLRNEDFYAIRGTARRLNEPKMVMILWISSRSLYNDQKPYFLGQRIDTRCKNGIIPCIGSATKGGRE
jgi:hypothetical protein